MKPRLPYLPGLVLQIDRHVPPGSSGDNGPTPLPYISEENLGGLPETELVMANPPMMIAPPINPEMAQLDPSRLRLQLHQADHLCPGLCLSTTTTPESGLAEVARPHCLYPKIQYYFPCAPIYIERSKAGLLVSGRMKRLKGSGFCRDP